MELRRVYYCPGSSFVYHPLNDRMSAEEIRKIIGLVIAKFGLKHLKTVGCRGDPPFNKLNS
jgi:hypothetical protein